MVTQLTSSKSPSEHNRTARAETLEFRPFMCLKTKIFFGIFLAWLCTVGSWDRCANAQRIQFPENSPGLRPISPTQSYSTQPGMVPLNPATQSGIYPSTGYGSPTFDPYGSPAPTLPPVFPSPFNSTVQPPSSLSSPLPSTQGVYPGGVPYGGYPTYNGPGPILPGAGPSATIGTFPSTSAGPTQPGMYPNSAPSALFPGSAYPSGAYNGTSGSGNSVGDWFSGIFGTSNTGFGGSYGQYPYPQAGYPGAPAYPNGAYPPAAGSSYFNPNTWNPQGTVFPPTGPPAGFVRLFQGTRFRHAYLYGNDDADALAINDSDLSLAFVFPNFFFSTQPLYLLPSFSLHQWSGPRPPSTADLPPLAYSAFLDSGWQSDPARIFGAELGLRVGVFSDFETYTSDSLRIQGRAIGRVRITPRATLKGGVIYIDRNKYDLLPAFGILWQPNPDTRFDLFFPEPKLAHYLSTVGTMDTWWYVGGYYGGGSWTVKRDSGANDSIDINDIRVVLGLEWGRNEQMREGRRVGFFEIGYAFDRELLYKNAPLDNLDLQDTFMFRAGIGY